MNENAHDPRGRIRALTVASWFPGVDDTTRGRFVADQADVLRASGRVDPVVISFEPHLLSGNALARSRQTGAVEDAARRGLASGEPPFAPRGWAGPHGIPVARLPIPSGNRAGAPADHMARDRVAALLAVADRLGSVPRTIVHAHTGYPDGAASVGLADHLGAPLVITEHASFVDRQLAQPHLRAAYAAGVARAARVVAVSETLADQLRRELPEWADRIVVIPNVVATDAFSVVPPDARRPDELLTVGYLAQGKGLDTLFAAVAKVRAVRPTVTLRLIGKSPTQELDARWRAAAREAGIADVVTFEGPRLREAVAEAMREASVLVHASRFETFGLVTLEALASGLPVVATRTGVIPQAFGDDARSLGALVPIDDADALATGILDTLERRMAFDPQRLRDAVESNFGRETVGRRLLALYDEVLDGASSSTASPASSSAQAANPSPLPDAMVATAPASASRPAVVVALDASRAASMLAVLPPALRARLSVVASTPTPDAPLPPDLGALTVVDLGELTAHAQRTSGPRGSLPVRILRVARHPLAWLHRRRAAARVDVLVTDAVRRAAAEARRLDPGGEAPAIACLDGRDSLAASPAIAAGSVKPLPGGVRWLGDRYADLDTAVRDAAASGTGRPVDDAALDPARDS
ncbi:MAG TPA: glycosyltransferase [Candidatus Limnocylindrales bacterium]